MLTLKLFSLTASTLNGLVNVGFNKPLLVLLMAGLCTNTYTTNTNTNTRSNIYPQVFFY